MELRVRLCAVVPNAAWMEYIAQLDDITSSRIRVQEGCAHPPDTPRLEVEGIGNKWKSGILPTYR